MAHPSIDFSHTWIPSYIPRSSRMITTLLVVCSILTSITLGYDGSMLTGLNIEPSYTQYFHLNKATEGLLTSSLYIGGCFSPLWGYVTDRHGRRPALLLAALIAIAAVVLQTAAQNIAMFVIARVLVGFGIGVSGVAAPVYLAETLPHRWRGLALGSMNNFYYAGGTIAAGIVYGTGQMTSTWAWRIPSAIQAVFSLTCIAIIPFVPESPRWLASQGYKEDALAVVAHTYADGDATNPIVTVAFREIVDTLEFEKTTGQKMSLMQIFKSRSARRRLTLVCSAAVFSTIAGNVIASYYFGQELTLAGIPEIRTQLEINIILNIWSLICAIAGTLLLDRVGRKGVAIWSSASMTVFIFMVGALSKEYAYSQNQSGIYAAVASIFLFQGAYSFGWTPLLYLYPPEVLNFSIRANGLGFFQFIANAVAVLIVFTMPIALENLGWKMYMINGGWDVIIVILIAYYWVETKGKTLEEIDEIFEGEKHSSVPDIAHVDAATAVFDDKTGSVLRQVNLSHVS